MKKLNVAIVGATGMVGATTLAILEERNFPINNLFLLASERSAGEKRIFRGKEITVESLEHFDFKNSDLCFFSVSNDLAKQYVPKAVDAGNIIIDKSSAYRYESDIPLVVPEVNFNDLIQFKNKSIIANPNCNTIPLVMALKPLLDAVGIERMNVATYQSVSGTGKDAVTELTEQTALVLNGKAVISKVYPQQIAFNVLPHIDDFEDNGYTREEMKIVWETQKIFNNKNIVINPTAVRVPVMCGHSAAVHIETCEKISAQKATELLSKGKGIKILEGKHSYPTPVLDAAGKDFVYVGRIRDDISHPKGLNLWVVADNLRKGAALNAIQIAETMLEHNLIG